MATAENTIRPWVLILGAVFLGGLWDLLFFKHLPGISVPIFWSAVVLTLSIFDRLTHRQMRLREIILIIPLLVLSVFYAIRASEFLAVLNGMAIAYLFLLLLAGLYGSPVRKYDIADFVFFPLIDLLGGVLQRLSFFKQLRLAKTETQRRISLGVILALLIGWLFVALFAQADQVVAELIRSIFSRNWLDTAGEHLLVIGFMSLFILLALIPSFWNRTTNNREPGIPSWKRDVGVEAGIVLGVSNALFLGFIVIQAVYLFGGEKNLAAFDISYASYAREGFFQLLVVALIVAAITWILRHTKDAHSIPLVIALNVGLIVQTFIILTSSWMRLSLYEQEFGFTHLRLFSHYFLIVVAIMLLILLGSLFIKKSNTFFLQSFIGVFTIALIGLNILNPDAFIAERNLNRAQQGFELDYRHLFRDLSDDATQQISDHVHSTEFQSQLAQSKTIENRRERIEQQIDIVYRLEVPEKKEELKKLHAELSSLESPSVPLSVLDRWMNQKMDTSWQAWNWARTQGNQLRTLLKTSPLYSSTN